MMIPLGLALFLTSVALTTSRVDCAPDAREHVELKPDTNELAVVCAKLGEPDGAKTGQKQELAEQEKASKPDPIVALMDEISRLKQELVPTEASIPSTMKKVRPPSAAVRVSNQQASESRTICEKSLAIGTLGYRILCQPNKKTLVEEKQKQQSQVVTQVASPVTTGGDATPKERAELPEQAEAGELRRLRSLFEQLDRRGNFRPIVRASSLR